VISANFWVSRARQLACSVTAHRVRAALGQIRTNSWMWGSVLLISILSPSNPALAETLGKLEITLAGRTQVLSVDDSSGGVDTYWAVGPVSILAQGKRGGTIQIGFEEDGVGLARGAYIIVTSADGSIWEEVDNSFFVTLTRADNVPPRFSVAGMFKGRIGYNGTTHPVSGTLDVLLPRQDFAPTPPDR
jgi:hypothetical protein